MKNIIKIFSFSLVATLAFGTVASASFEQAMGPSVGLSTQSNGNSTGSTVSAPATQSNGNSAGTVSSGPSTQSNGNSAGTVSSNGGNTGSTGSSQSSGSRSSGGSSGRTFALTNVTVNVVGNTATVSFESAPALLGRVVFGNKSVEVPTSAEFYGYTNGTAFSGMTTKHTHSFTVNNGETVFVRPIIANQTRIVYGSELKITVVGNKNTPAVKTAKPAVGTVEFDNSNKTIKIDTTIPSDVEVSKATSSVNVANVKDATPSKFVSFLKKIWNIISAPFCK